MKTLLRLLPFLAVAIIPLRGADDELTAAVLAADDERIAATVSADRARLDAILSNELHYGHAHGAVQTKASLVDSIVSKQIRYLSIDCEERNFKPIAPGVVLMAGHGHFKVGSASQPNDLHLGFLAVWREEAGKWRLLAWQSCRYNPPAAAPAQ